MRWSVALMLLLLAPPVGAQSVPVMMRNGRRVGIADTEAVETFTTWAEAA